MATSILPHGALSSGEATRLIELDAGPFKVTMSDFGATLLSFMVPDGEGGMVDLILGHDTIAEYESSESYLGATVGRFANRIARGAFSLDGKGYSLATNNGPNHLHGGPRGFSRRSWRVTTYEEGGGSCARFELQSPAGDEGYPGCLETVATYRLFPDGSLDILFEAKTDAPTIVNLTQHAYFNLHGNGEGTVLDHTLKLAASRYLPVDSSLIPTGELAAVDGGAFDFRAEKPIGRDIKAVGGYDHCFVLDKPSSMFEGELIAFAELHDEESGRTLLASTTLPGVQLYTGNFLAGVKGRGGREFARHSGLCLETQLFPDSPNQPAFPSATLRPGETWSHRTRFSFRD